MAGSPKTAKTLDLSPEDALFQGRVGALVAMLHSNERPLRGLAGILDWRFRGEISRAIRLGALEGAPGECAYLPIRARGKNPRVFHLILFGRGAADRSGVRAVPQPAALEALRKNLVSLKLEPVGISRSDFGNPSSDHLFESALKGVPLCVVP